MNAAVWHGLPADLALGHRLTAIELPGHGGSPCVPSWQGLDDWVEACLAAAPARAVWLGWSLGGLVALAAARRAPERLTGLVALTATPRFVQADTWPAAMDPKTLARFHDGLLADPTGTLERFLAIQVRGSEAARETLRRLKQELAARPSPDPAALAWGLDLLRQSDLRPALQGLDCPSLWLFGARDTLVPAAVGADIATLLPEARVQVIAGAAHAPFLSHPVETTAALLSFLWELEI
ncbi:MAG: pimeloyl-ACP methyl ester esterase BioH [Chromatiaceae bacterium]|nr:pimeloyl-ACP methyl ester esterase BioH [Chromatiaceae bacterium]MBP8289144.1 pimeloyl-ACP methyl ester esterase BioH [Chromatiaceae bacterium]